MYRKGKKAASNTNKDPEPDSWTDINHYATGRAPPGFVPNRGPEAAASESRDYYAELQNTPVYSEICGAQRSELHSDIVTKAELPSDAEVDRAGGRRW